MAYTEQQLIAALRKADAAGDEAAARVIAKRIQGMRAQPMDPAAKLANEDRLTGTSLNPTDGMSGLDRYRAGFAKAFPDLARGVTQFANEAARYNPYLLAGDAVSGGAVSDTLQLDQRAESLRKEADEVSARDAPLMNTGAGLAGNITGQMAQLWAAPAAGGSTLAGKLGAAAVEGGAFGAVQPVGQDDSRLNNTLIGGGLGAVGQGVATGASTAARGMLSRLAPDARALAENADQAGIQLGVGNLTGNQSVRNAISQMERLPLSGASSRNAANQDAFNEAVGGTFGAKGNKITPDVFRDAKDALSDEFERLTARNTLAPTPELLARLAAIKDKAERLGGADSGRMVAGQIDELMSKAGLDGMIPGQAYQAFDSELGEMLKNGGYPAVYLGQMRDAVRGAMDESITPADKAAWQNVRRQWASLKTVEPLVAKAEGGNIPATQLINKTTGDKSGKARMATGRGGEIGELARIGQAFFKKAPDSGTADRLGVNLGVAGVVGGTSYFSPEAAGLAALLLGGNRLGLKALSSRGLVQGNSRTLNGLSRLVQPAPKLLPAAGAAMTVDAPLDIGTVSGYAPNDPRYRGY